HRDVGDVDQDALAVDALDDAVGPGAHDLEAVPLCGVDLEADAAVVGVGGHGRGGRLAHRAPHPRARLALGDVLPEGDHLFDADHVGVVLRVRAKVRASRATQSRLDLGGDCQGCDVRAVERA